MPRLAFAFKCYRCMHDVSFESKSLFFHHTKHWVERIFGLTKQAEQLPLAEKSPPNAFIKLEDLNDMPYASKVSKHWKLEIICMLGLMIYIWIKNTNYPLIICKLSLSWINGYEFHKQVVKESLRMASVVPWFPRLALQDCEIHGLFSNTNYTLVILET